MSLFKCEHKLKYLQVAKDVTREKSETHPKDFVQVTMHLHCINCNAELEIGYAELIGTVDEFMRRES